ncbi:MAG: PAS domain S-box-containing protein [Gammaproteobacteria bacterium]|jgi:PAS domain S-box-containing protein
MARASWTKRLWFQQAVLTLIVAILVAFTVSLFDAFITLRENSAKTEQELAYLLYITEPAAAQAVFQLDLDLAEKVTRGLMVFPSVASVLIVDDSGQVLARADQSRKNTRAPGWLVEMAFGELAEIRRSLAGHGQPLGSLSVQIDKAVMMDALIQNYWDNIATDIAKSFILALVLSGVVYRLLTKPIVRLSQSVQAVELGEAVPFQTVLDKWHHSDELGTLEEAMTRQFSLFQRTFSQRGKLLEELRLHEHALESMNSGVLIFDAIAPSGPIVSVNRAFVKISGIAEVDLLGQSYRVLVETATDPEVRVQFVDHLFASMDSGKSFSEVQQIRHQDGSLLWIEFSLAPIRNAEGLVTHTVVIVVDITKVRADEELLRRSQKMDALGKITGGIAHDFNNILAIIMGNVELLSTEVQSEPEQKKRIRAIMQSAERASELTRRLLRFSRKGPVRQKHIELDMLIDGMHEMLQLSLTPEINIKVNLDAGGCVVSLDTGDFEDALINLAVNARDAMNGRGELSVATRTVELTKGNTCLNDAMPIGSYVEIVVADKGMGMSKETCEHIFEPFFTTKDESKGTGLGLAQVYGFVERCNGSIRVQSTLGEGTMFFVYLPELRGVRSESTHERRRPATQAGIETVLVVDDEEGLVAVSQALLQRLGYTVLTANSPAQALREWQRSQLKIDLLVSDIVMPGEMNGIELADQLTESDPNLKVLLVSGYISQKLVGDDERAKRYTLINKPYSLSDFGQSVRAVLNEA